MILSWGKVNIKVHVNKVNVSKVNVNKVNVNNVNVKVNVNKVSVQVNVNKVNDKVNDIYCHHKSSAAAFGRATTEDVSRPKALPAVL